MSGAQPISPPTSLRRQRQRQPGRSHQPALPSTSTPAPTGRHEVYEPKIQQGPLAKLRIRRSPHQPTLHQPHPHPRVLL
eukprot:3420778-Rhodomonas_salina.1